MVDSESAGREPVRRVIYFADPMCSWCWGFAPVIAAVHDMLGAWAPISPVMGGLRPGTINPMRDKDKAAVRHHWEAVHKETGQPFDFSLFDRDNFVYDTEPACRAVVAVRSVAPEQTLRYLHAVQRAFYAEGRDVTTAATLADIAGEFGIGAEAFADMFAAPDMAAATRADFKLTQSAGISGFPSVILQQADEFAPLTVGYRPFALLQPHLQAWMNAASAS
ncbi:MAG: DsbA family protein [Rhodospirillales bacterium]|nr:DsbA family protein [Rhodospirillales bacterium]